MIEMHKGACLFSSYVSKVDIFPEYIHLTFLYSLTCDQQRAYAQIHQTENICLIIFTFKKLGPFQCIIVCCLVYKLCLTLLQPHGL